MKIGIEKFFSLIKFMRFKKKTGSESKYLDHQSFTIIKKMGFFSFKETIYKGVIC